MTQNNCTDDLMYEGDKNQQAGDETPEPKETESATSGVHDVARDLKSDLANRLCGAREQQGRTLAECASALRMPVHVLQKLERGDYSGIDHGVYLRHYLRKYGTHLGLDATTLEETVETLAPRTHQPSLVSTCATPHAHPVWQRYTTAATYVVLTAVIVVPLVWLGIRGGLDSRLSSLQSPDNGSAVQNATAGDAAASGVDQTDADNGALNNKTRQAGAVSDSSGLLMASMAPFAALEYNADGESEPDHANHESTTADNDDAGSGGQREIAADKASDSEHALHLAVDQDSWVQIVTQGGEKLEYSLLSGGSEHSYRSSQPLRVKIGNADAVSATVDGDVLDLGDYQHAAVARFRIDPDSATLVSGSNE